MKVEMAQAACGCLSKMSLETQTVESSWCSSSSSVNRGLCSCHWGMALEGEGDRRVERLCRLMGIWQLITVRVEGGSGAGGEPDSAEQSPVQSTTQKQSPAKGLTLCKSS